jgi:hypothetical protein
MQVHGKQQFSLVSIYSCFQSLSTLSNKFVRFRHKKGRDEGGSLLPGPKPGSQGFTQIGEGLRGINGEGREGGEFEERLREEKTSPGYPIGQHFKHRGAAE